RLARPGPPRLGRRRPDRRALVPAPGPRRDLGVARGVLQALLFPAEEDGRDDARDADERRNAEAPTEGGRRVRSFSPEARRGRVRRLVVTGDDFGASRSVNRAIIEAHRRGVLTHASLMVTGDAVDEAVRLARANPGLSVGIHLVLVDGRSALPPSRIPHL